MRGDVTSGVRKRELAGAELPPFKRGRPTNAERLAREVAAAAASRGEAATQGRIGVMTSIAGDGKKLHRLAIASGTGHAAHAAAPGPPRAWDPAYAPPPPPPPPPLVRSAAEIAADAAAAAAKAAEEEQTVRAREEAERGVDDADGMQDGH